MTETSMLWRRLDTPGHDACRLEGSDVDWRLYGTAVFLQDGVPARLGYSLTCDRSWRTQHGRVSGWVGPASVEFRITRTSGGAWCLNGEVVPVPEHCIDLDLGFTPATNLVQLRRLALAVGNAADAPVAWLDSSVGTLDVLAQRYERRSETTYWYEAPRFEYEGLLEVTPAGFVYRYPGLWVAEP
jgi:uncharacterized protein